MNRKIEGISVMSELGAGTRGASLGFAALQVADWKKGGNFFQKLSFDAVPCLNDWIYNEVDTPNALNLEGIAETFPQISKRVQACVERGNMPFIISGDHSSAAACMQGVKAAIGDKSLGAFWVDAHADLHSPYTTPSGNVHGMPLAIASHEENLPCKINTIKGKTLSLWEQVKGDTPAIEHKDIVFAAVRDTEEPERKLMERFNIKNFLVEDFRTHGAEWVAKGMLEKLSHCDHIYLSFDVDSLDCDLVSLGTGTPVPNGLTEEEATTLLIELVKDPRIIAFEVVEVNPTLDNKGNVMAETALRIIEAVYNSLSA